jgi:hypothetical protein
VGHQVEGVAGAAGQVGERVAEQVILQAQLGPLAASALVAQVVAFTLIWACLSSSKYQRLIKKKHLKR